MYIQTNLKQEFLSTTKYDGLIPLPKSEEPGKPTLDCRTLQLLFQWERAKKKQTKKAQKPNPTTEITENSLKILAEIKTAAKFYPFVLSPSIILMLYSFFFFLLEICGFPELKNNTKQVGLYRASSKPFIQKLEQKFSCPLYVDFKNNTRHFNNQHSFTDLRQLVHEIAAFINAN